MISAVVFAPAPAGTSQVDVPGGAVTLIDPPVSTFCSVISTSWPLLLSTRNVRVPAAMSSAGVHKGIRSRPVIGTSVDSGTDDSGSDDSGTDEVGSEVVGATVVALVGGTVVGSVVGGGVVVGGGSGGVGANVVGGIGSGGVVA